MRRIFPRNARDCRKHDHVLLRVTTFHPMCLAPDLHARAVLCERCGALMIHPDHIKAAAPADQEV